MEKTDVLAIAFIVFAIIISCYILYLKAGIDFLLEKIAECRNDINDLVKIEQDNIKSQNKINEAQAKINKTQNDFNKYVSKFIDIVNKEISSTGGKKQPN